MDGWGTCSMGCVVKSELGPLVWCCSHHSTVVPDSRHDSLVLIGIPWWWHHSWLGGENCGLGGRRPWGELINLSSLVTMETCNWLLSSKNDQKACVLEGVQSKLPKREGFPTNKGWCVSAWTPGIWLSMAKHAVFWDWNDRTVGEKHLALSFQLNPEGLNDASLPFPASPFLQFVL